MILNQITKIRKKRVKVWHRTMVEDKDEIVGELQEKGLTSKEASRVVDIWEKEENGEAEFISAEEAWKKLGGN